MDIIVWSLNNLVKFEIIFGTFALELNKTKKILKRLNSVMYSL